MKWILIGLLIVVVMLIAYSVSEQYKEKYDFYLNLKNFLNQFKLNLAFKQEKIINFLNNINAKKQFNLFIQEYKNYLNNNELNLSQIKILDDDEKQELTEIITNIGCMDAANEIQQLETFLLAVEEKLKTAEEQKQKLCPMILKLSLLFAIAVSIILM